MKASKKVLKNVFFLGTVQAFNYLVPIIIIPILIDRIGLERYGLISLAQGIMILLIPITDFGLNLTGTRLTSQIKGQSEFNKNIRKIILGKLVLLIPCFIMLFLLSSIVPKWKEHQDLLLWSYFMVAGHSLFPMWYFIGTQKTGTLSLLNLISRLLYLAAVFFLINDTEDFYLVNVYNGIGWVIVSFIGLLIIKRDLLITNFRINLDMRDVLALTKSNSSIFFSNFMNSAYRSGAIVIAGFLLNSTSLGIYGVLDKVMNLISNSFIVLYNAIFPRVCLLAIKSKRLVTSFYRKLLPRIGSLVLLGSILLGIFGAKILGLLIDEITTSDVKIYFYLIALFPIIVFLNLPFSLTFVSFDLKKEYLIYNIGAFITFATTGSLLGSEFGIVGLLLAILVTEALIFFLGLYLTKTRGISII